MRSHKKEREKRNKGRDGNISQRGGEWAFRRIQFRQRLDQQRWNIKMEKMRKSPGRMEVWWEINVSVFLLKLNRYLRDKLIAIKVSYFTIEFQLNYLKLIYIYIYIYTHTHIYIYIYIYIISDGGIDILF